MLPNVWQDPYAPTLQGGSATSFQDTASAQTLQPTAEPVGTLGGGTSGGGGGGGGVVGPVVGGGGGGGWAPAPAGNVEADNLRNEIISRRSRANSIFEIMTDRIRDIAQERRGDIEGQYKSQTRTALENFTEKGDELRRVYAGRGLADSSYRVMGEDRAGRDYSRAITDLGGQRSSGLAQIGQEAVGQRARINADQESISSFNLDEIGDDVDALTSVRNTLDQRIREAQIKQAELNTSKGFRGQLDKIAPYTGVTKVLQSSLQSLIGMATPQVVKDRIASALIKNYSGEDYDYWKDYYDTETSKTASDTSAA